MVLRFLPRLFPVPRLLAMGGGGIEISDRSIKYLKLDHRRDGASIVSFGEEPLPEGVVADGDIRNAAALAAPLASVRSRCGFSFVHASLPEQKGYLFDLTVPRAALDKESADKSTLAECVVVELPSHAPLSPAEAVYDCETVEAESGEFGRSVVVTAFPEAAAAAYADAFIAAGFTPLSFELEPQAALRALGIEKKSAILVDYGEGKSIISVAQHGIIRFTTSIEGTASFDKKLLSELGAESAQVPTERKEKRKESADAYSRIVESKIEEGLAPGSVVGDTLQSSAAALAAEVRRVGVFWRSHAAGAIAPEEVILYGGNADVRGLPEYLSAAADIPARVADVRSLFGGAHSVPPIPKDQILRFTTVLGLSLRSSALDVW